MLPSLVSVRSSSLGEHNVRMLRVVGQWRRDDGTTALPCVLCLDDHPSMQRATRAASTLGLLIAFLRLAL